MKTDELEPLRVWAAPFGIRLTREQVRLLEIYLSELWEWNRKVNLTGLSSLEEVIRELLFDSLLPSPFLPSEGKVLDMGSGAGFPAIPLKICNPRLDFCLIEANFKKSVFLKEVVRRTGLKGIEVIRGRIEEGLLPPEGFEAVTSRAMSALTKTLDLGLPYLKAEGFLIAFLGSRAPTVMKDLENFLGERGVLVEKIVPYTLPGKKAQRHLAVFRKMG